MGFDVNTAVLSLGVFYYLKYGVNILPSTLWQSASQQKFIVEAKLFELSLHLFEKDMKSINFIFSPNFVGYFGVF